MKDFLKKILSAIVDAPEQAEIASQEENGQTIYTLLAPKDEVGRVIGKEGRVINAIRCLARLKAAKTGEKIYIKVEEKV